MSGRPNKAWLKTMVEKHGSREAVTEVMSKLGSQGGRKSRKGGYAHERVGKDGLTGRERASIYGAVGGKKSSRKGVKNK